jgi:hypothetical protein
MVKGQAAAQTSVVPPMPVAASGFDDVQVPQVPPKRKKHVPKDESKRVKFLRLANHRVNAAIKRIDQIGNLGGAGYEKNAADIKKICEAIHKAVDKMQMRLAGSHDDEKFSI